MQEELPIQRKEWPQIPLGKRNRFARGASTCLWAQVSITSLAKSIMYTLNGKYVNTEERIDSFFSLHKAQLDCVYPLVHILHSHKRREPPVFTQSRSNTHINTSFFLLC